MEQGTCQFPKSSARMSKVACTGGRGGSADIDAAIKESANRGPAVRAAGIRPASSGRGLSQDVEARGICLRCSQTSASFLFVKKGGNHEPRIKGRKITGNQPIDG